MVMFTKKRIKKTVPSGAPGSDSQKPASGGVAQYAPAVALLLLGDSPYATADTGTVPEPSVVWLFAAGAAAAGTVKYIQNKRRK